MKSWREYSNVTKMKFVLYSLIGIFMFFTPIDIGGRKTIALDHLVVFFLGIPHFKILYGSILVVIGALLPFYRKTWNKDRLTLVFSLLKLLGIPFVFMMVFQKGPDFLMRKDMIPFIYDKIVVPVTTIVPIGSVFLALIISYGLMEFVGVFMQTVMRPVWKTPGRSAIDAVASFVGSYSIALLITNRVYKEGKYTDKEAVIIATGFSTVSVTFMIIVAKTLGIMEIWNIYFWATVLVTFLVTAITARLYPISRKEEKYFQKKEGNREQEVRENRFQIALESGLYSCEMAPGIVKNTIQNLKDGILLASNIAPSLMSIGVIGLILANYTPIFTWIGFLFYPFMSLARVPDAMLASKALAMGIAEMFLPALLVTESAFATKMIIAITCVSEVLFFSASIPCMMGTEIPISFKEYFIIWFERVVLSILISIPVVWLIQVIFHIS